MGSQKKLSWTHVKWAAAVVQCLRRGHSDPCSLFLSPALAQSQFLAAKMLWLCSSSEQAWQEPVGDVRWAKEERGQG